jgi:hypothetical protein
MMLEPELLIGYATYGNPVSAACSQCGEWMLEDYAPNATRQEILAKFVEHFNVHVGEKHGQRYVN